MTATQVHTSDLNDGYDWSCMKSTTELGSLDEFLETAQLAGTEFVAEKMNVTVIKEEQNEAVLTEDREKSVAKISAAWCAQL